MKGTVMLLNKKLLVAKVKITTQLSQLKWKMGLYSATDLLLQHPPQRTFDI